MSRLNSCFILILKPKPLGYSNTLALGLLTLTLFLILRFQPYHIHEFYSYAEPGYYYPRVTLHSLRFTSAKLYHYSLSQLHMIIGFTTQGLKYNSQLDKPYQHIIKLSVSYYIAKPFYSTNNNIPAL